MADYELLYALANEALAMYQDEIVPNLREKIAELERNRVEVVRCKYCKHWKHFSHLGCTDFAKVCGLANYMIGENGYCLYGERKEKGDK